MKRFLLLVFVFVINFSFAATNYVSLTGNNISPYDTWVKAATNIQFAVDAASDGDVVLVQTGRFVGVAEDVSGSMITITKAIILKSVNGAEETTIDGVGWHRRCIYINNPGAIVRGFLIELGYARTNFGPNISPIVSSGGGVFFDGAGTVEDCIFRFNRAGLSGGNAYMNGGGTLRNCLIIDGGADLCGGVYCTNGGIIESCTIVDNWTLSISTNLAGGVWCINGGEIINSILYANSNIVGNAVDVHNVGTGWSYSYSRVPASVSGEGNISSEPLFENKDNDNFALKLNSPCLNAGINQGWMTDAKDLSGNPRISQDRVDMGAYELALKYFVSVNGEHKSPFTLWKTAATNIQAAIDVAIPTSEIIVSNGTYFPASEIRINTNITVSSLNGRDETIVDGRNSIPCFNIENPEAILSGFTIANGTRTNGGGGGISLRSGTVTNCIIQDCYTAESGGGISIKGGVLQNSEIKNCEASQFGGGITMESGLVESCIINNNEGSWAGGGVMFQGGELRSCLIVSNATPANPLPPNFGGMRLGGGGIFSLPSNLKIINCTIADNFSEYEGGGVYDIDFFGSGATTFYENTVLYFNTALLNGNNYIGGNLYFLYSCTTPKVPIPQDGGENISSNPLLAVDYQLTFDSPCKNSGTNMAWMVGATDLAGNARISSGTVDMGAYEFVPEPMLFWIFNFGIWIFGRKFIQKI